MSGKLLTIIPAAACLGVTKATLYNWRVRGKGPAWVELSDDRPAASRPRQSRIRYDTDDLLRFQRRVEGKLDLVKPLQQRVHLPSQPLLSDAQWAIVDAALRWEGKMGRLAGTRYMDRARSELEALLAVAMEGAAKEAEGFIRRGGAACGF